MRKISLILLVVVLVLGCFVAAQGAEAIKILHGPYLLGATENSIKIIWEASNPADFMVEHGLSDSYGEIFKPILRRGSPYEEISLEGIYLYEAEITGLETDTVYNYRISSSLTSSENSTFKTLPGDDQPFKFTVIADTHGFETAEVLTKQTLDYQPDFIMNCGDIPIGYGFQYDQFDKYFFKPMSKLLREIPTFHARGNHDVGCFWDDFFDTQALGLPNYGGTPSAPLPWFSFNVGNAHFIVLDSNQFFPVELAEMDEQFEWLIEDLESDAAKNATWRFIFEHHPYRGHEPVVEYIVPLMEKYDVDFLWAGHTHAYCKVVSLKPEIGTGNIFMTTGTASQAQGSVSFAPPPPRSGYPNVIAYGRNDYTTVEVNGDTVHVQAYTTLPGVEKDTPNLLDDFTICKEEPKLQFTNLEISPKNIEVGESVTIKVTVKNLGKGLAAIPIKISDNGEPVVKYVIGPEGQERVVVLNPGESEAIETSLQIFGTDRHEIKVADFSPVTVALASLDPTFVYSDMKVDVGEGLNSDEIQVTAVVKNIGSSKGATDAKLYVDGEAVCSKAIALESEQNTILTFLYKFTESGTHLVNVGDLEPLTLEIQGTLALTPIVPDLSGFGNNGIMRGDPQWVDGKVGKAVDFDGEDDYVEVPDSESLHITDEFTAVVWGNVNQLDTEKNHSATLLVKGPSTGWGPTYLVRMLFRGSGGYTSGTCYDGVEFAWEGGWLNPEDIGKWRQYISTYEKPTSTGYSYINLEKVAESAGGGTPLNYWEGYPLMSGLAYAGNTDPISRRGSSPFLLNGKVDEIRFYNVHLSEDERQEIYKHPERLGPKSDNLVVWLSFDEIENQGSYTTEWRKPIMFTPSYAGEKTYWTWDTLTANVSIPKGAGIEAIIQVSDNGETIKDSKNVVLKDGINSYDISDLERAQYIRIMASFDSTVKGTVIPIPKLDRYAVNATLRGAKTEIVWSTRADWEKGEITGAVGFEPVGRF